jgi:hypothetical protein
MTYHQMMQNHLDTRPALVTSKDLTPMQLLEYSRRPLPVFVNGVRTDGPVGAVERLELVKGGRS